MLMPNPWHALPETGSNFVLPQDSRSIAAANEKAKPDHRVDLGLLPEPFLGRPDAAVVLLNLNPGWSPNDEQWHAKPGFRTLSRDNLLHNSARYPFYLLDPAIAESPGAVWWKRRLRALIRHFRTNGLKLVASHVLCVEYFPYHSCHFDKRWSVSSQEYSRHLVANAMKSDRLVVGMRAKSLWEAALPDLETYQRACWLNSPQNVSITPNNCARYNDVVHALGQANATRPA